MLRMGIPESVLLKVQRADKHLADLEASGRRFQRAKPNSVTIATDPETGDRVWVVHIHEGPPPTHAVIAGDVVHTLRTALDHMMCALVEANGGTVTKATEFPIFESARSYEVRAAEKVQGARQEAIDAIGILRPYRGGNDGFWKIHKLDIIDKHRSLLAVVGSYEELIVDPARKLVDTAPPGALPEGLSAPIRLTPKRRCPLNDGDVLFRVPAASFTKSDHETKFRLNIAFNEPGVVECEPMFPALSQLYGLTKGTIETLSAFL